MSSFWESVPEGFVRDPRTKEAVPSRPTPGELYELLALAAGPNFTWSRQQQSWLWHQDPVYASRAYIELSRRGWEVPRLVAREVLIAVFIDSAAQGLASAAVEGGRPALRLVEAS
ncbi:hypothetical protein [Cyanobium sp. N5-Cardenillas]|uniref:hypothetical protein n=1 Tax=Cyanobium sp. N5-Cardenillas TaxID=2823720 RepID=UPI0020CCE361|nr:hypothetical protein [Cyanobium sp. N5-Cardenillas]MCP9786012.1 hypothetical protein [Cyanobium sp. N5-Cardenillas]